MSRQIDLTKPLSDEDREYLESRARHREVEINDAEFGDTVASGNVPDDSLEASTERSPDAQPASVGDQNPEGIPSPVAEVLADAEAEDSEEDIDNYDSEPSWSYAELQAEAKDRKLPAGGSRAEIIARLREYDEHPDN